MSRWAPGADLRLRDAALELFAQDGFDQVTVEQIAEAAGVTERTFFRHFSTKEDVIFANGEQIIAELADAVRGESNPATPARLLLVALTRLANSFEPDRSALRIRAEIIRSVPALRERELLKQHHISTAIVDELVSRSISKERAMTLAGVGMVVFQVAYGTWVTDRSRTSLATRIEKTLTSVTADLVS
jgi:AcrR family transcriptional regulator